MNSKFIVNKRASSRRWGYPQLRTGISFPSSLLFIFYCAVLPSRVVFLTALAHIRGGNDLWRCQCDQKKRTPSVGGIKI